MKVRMNDRLYRWSISHAKQMGLFLIALLLGFGLWLKIQLYKLGGNMKRKSGLADIALVCVVALVAMAFTAVCGGRGGFHYRTSEVTLTHSASNVVSNSASWEGGGSLPVSIPVGN